MRSTCRPSKLALGVAMLLATSTGCKLKDGGPTPASSTTVTSGGAVANSGTPATPATPGRAELESHLTYGQTWGNEPNAQRIAKAAFKTAEDHMGADPSEVAVAVRTIESQPRQIVILIKLKDLKDETSSERKAMLEELRDDLGDGFSQVDVLTVGVRGSVLYGAVAQGTRAGYKSMNVARSVGTATLDAALATPAAPEAVPTTVAIGVPVRVGSLDYVVKEVKDAGKKVKSDGKAYATPGRFVFVHLVATSHAAKPITATPVIRLVDDKGREFGPHPNSADIVPPDDDADPQLFEAQPDVPIGMWVAYELPAGAKGIRVKIKGPEFATPGFVTTKL